MSWRLRKQVIYGATYIFIIALIFGATAYSLLHKPTTCLDGKKNQDELGIDCGGSCRSICSFSVTAPVVAWQKVFKVSSTNYTAVAYVQNPNVGSDVLNAPYMFTIYDGNNNVLETRTGSTYIPSGRTFAIIEPRITSNNGVVPARAAVTFGKLAWEKSAPQPILESLNVSLSTTTAVGERPAVHANIQNDSLSTVPYIDIAAIVYDTDQNAVGASKTYIQNLVGNESRSIAFTWPEPFITDLTSCATPVDIIVAIDRSGSMASDGKNPVEPLTSVKKAAESFISQIGANGRASVISFATMPSLDKGLTNSLSDLQLVTDAISIHTDGTQYTNIADTIKMAESEFSKDSDPGRKKALILLTDGIANYPDPTHPEVAATAAQQEATNAKNNGIALYTIGLGSEVDATFLRGISADDEHYYSAVSSSDVARVYKNISTTICNKQPIRAEIIPIAPPAGSNTSLINASAQ